MGMEVKLLVTPKQIGMLGPGSRNLDLVVKKASKSRGMTSGSMPFPEPNRDVDAPRCPTAMFPPSPGGAVLFDADYAGIQAPRISNKPAVHRLSSSHRMPFTLARRIRMPTPDAGFGIFALRPVFWTLPTAFLSGTGAAAGIARGQFDWQSGRLFRSESLWPSQ